ncbi:adenosine deaminase [uncultured Amaricoccus sp.]|mgnify:FL=1|uniref:adenosine deaminase n=1 Tax=uncultured Amaricoccus sp. TaxID=339341 RepID=UPI00262C4DB7|nr:adenosine deaminase [uncultured Amaricoccus sp.]
MTVWRRQPKVELHLHLEGAAPPDFIRALAAEQGTDLVGVFDEAGAYAWTDFADFLKVYEAASSVLRAADDYRRLVEAVLAKSAADGVIYTEIFLAPDLRRDDDTAAWRDHLAAMTEGARNARAAHGIEARFIPIAIRHLGPERAEATARLTAETAGGLVTGFGMAGEEGFGEPADYARAFAIAAEAGLGLTVHAGELLGAESVRAALDALPVSRIGHGVRAIEDPDLVRRLAAEGIVLEVNPGSNLALGLFPSWRDHPIEPLRAAGVAVTISTDDPPYFHTDLPREYAALAWTFDWTAADFDGMNRAAAAAAFCDEATRAAILARLTGETP